jgi:hypothetical protein
MAGIYLREQLKPIGDKHTVTPHKKNWPIG